jgi:hypothetical protein
MAMGLTPPSVSGAELWLPHLIIELPGRELDVEDGVMLVVVLALPAQVRTLLSTHCAHMLSLRELSSLGGLVLVWCCMIFHDWNAGLDARWVWSRGLSWAWHLVLSSSFQILWAEWSGIGFALEHWLLFGA